MSLEKIKIEGVIYDVVSEEEYNTNPEICGPYTAIDGQDGLVYPVRSIKDNRPGFYPTGALSIFLPPAIGEHHIYSKQNIINFREASTLREIIQSQQKLDQEERQILTSIDNVFAPEIGENDTPEMQAMKQAIIDKHIDLDKYEPRFGPNYNNDKRLLKKDSITFGKIRSICDALDADVYLTIRDKDPDVPNPIGREITVKITSGSSDNEGE